MQARDVMTERVITVAPDTRVKDVAELLLEKGISAVPVEDADGHIIGMVSEADLMHHAEIGPEKPQRWWITMSQTELLDAYQKTHGLKARDVMHKGVHSVSPKADLVDVVAAMETHGVKRILVMEDSRLRGIITRSNLLRGFFARGASSEASEDDRAIRAKLLKELRSQRWTTIADTNILVVEGIVSLWGCVSSVEERDALRAAVEAIPSVKGVEDHTVLIPGESIRRR